MDGQAMDETYRLTRQIAEHNERMRMSGGIEDMTRAEREQWERAHYGNDLKPSAATNKYARNINGASVDVYDILHAYKVTNPAVQHAIKKLLQPGERGHKDRITDLNEAKQSIERAIEVEAGK